MLGQALERALRRPLVATDAQALPASESEFDLRQRLAGRRVLLVEDNLINQEVAGELLEIAGLVVEIADDGARAVELMRGRRFDIVLMDVQMPVMDGLTATRMIRESGDTTPILAMTANAFGEERAACLASGMSDHVAKPVDPALLYAALSHWLSPKVVAPGGAPGALVADSNLASSNSPSALLQRLSAVRGLDPEAALRAVGGKIATLERTMLRFCKTYADSERESTFGRGNLSVARLKSLSHSLRGACGAIGATALQRELSRFEKELDSDSKQETHVPRVLELNEQLKQFVEALKTALSR
jgi:CheY-like chemotaxis protein